MSCTTCQNGNRNCNTIFFPITNRKLAVLAGSYRDMSINTVSMDGMGISAVVSGKSEIPAFAYDSEKEL